VLQLRDISLQLGSGDDAKSLLNDISLVLPVGHFTAILGPSGCGKSTLLKVIAGIREHTLGTIMWKGRDLAEEGDLHPQEIGYVPQFSIAHELLTVDECVESALRLRVAGLSHDEQWDKIEAVLKEVGLDEMADRQVRNLSGGQKRRLALAIELASSPHLLMCDEVTSGLDPKAEDEVVRLLKKLSQQENRLVLSVTHSLRHVTLYDSVIVLHQGRLAYHGSPQFLTHYFGIESAEDLYPKLSERSLDAWHRSWVKHRPAYYAESKLPQLEGVTVGQTTADMDPADSSDQNQKPLSALSEEEQIARLRKMVADESEDEMSVRDERGPKRAESNERKEPEPRSGSPRLPSFIAQVSLLLSRRAKLFTRDIGQLILHCALILGFPGVVVIFALDGLPAIKTLAQLPVGNVVEQLQNTMSQSAANTKVGGLVSSLIMFQVVLLALMGANNAAREISGERHLLEKEKFAGLNPVAYVMSKALFLGGLVIVQSVWMGLVVNLVVGFPGNFIEQLIQLTLLNGAITAVCLAISSWARTAEQSSLLSVYLVGFQLPLSGAVLALPKAIGVITQAFIAAFWGWSGFIMAMRETSYFSAVQNVTDTTLHTGVVCAGVLGAHIVIGLIAACLGCKDSRWEA
jgi:ABC-type multidrug transport system ATPase subunit